MNTNNMRCYKILKLYSYINNSQIINLLCTAAYIACFGPTKQVENTNFDGFDNLRVKANWHKILSNRKGT